MSLIGEERKAYIMQQLNLEGKVRTFDLVNELKVSSETIRKYLEELEADNKLKRVYGGAMKLDAAREEPVYLTRETLYSEEKRRIGRAAATLVEDGDVVFIDDGTTTLQMIEGILAKQNITILTISVAGMCMLIDYANRGLFSGKIIFIGGEIDATQSRSTGAVAVRMAELFNVDKAFVSVDGLTIDRGLTGFDASRGVLARQIIEHAKQTIVVADKTKFGQTQLFKIADLQEIDLVVSDVAAPAGWKTALETKQVTWIAAE